MRDPEQSQPTTLTYVGGVLLLAGMFLGLLLVWVIVRGPQGFDDMNPGLATVGLVVVVLPLVAFGAWLLKSGGRPRDDRYGPRW